MSLRVYPNSEGRVKWSLQWLPCEIARGSNHGSNYEVVPFWKDFFGQESKQEVTKIVSLYKNGRKNVGIYGYTLNQLLLSRQIYMKSFKKCYGMTVSRRNYFH